MHDWNAHPQYTHLFSLTLTGAEDAEGMSAQRRQFHWDKRKRKYVQVSGADAKSASGSSKRIRTESGKNVEKDKVRVCCVVLLVQAGVQFCVGMRAAFVRAMLCWMQSQHKRVAPVGTQQSDT